MIRSNETATDPPDDLLLTHKTLMALLLQYEHLTKRISSIQCAEGGNQATVQGAVARMAATFLTKEMLKVQVCLAPPNPAFLPTIHFYSSPPAPFPPSASSPRPLALVFCGEIGEIKLIIGTTTLPETAG